MVLLSEKRMKLDPLTHMYLESVSPGECHEHIYKATPLSVLKKKEAKNGIFARKKSGVTGLKLWHADTT